jgi:hypothetical protein
MRRSANCDFALDAIGSVRARSDIVSGGIDLAASARHPCSLS